MGTRTNIKPYNPIPWHGSPHDFTGSNNLGVYTEETVQRYICGTRFTTWDGRVFKYSRGIAAVRSGYGAQNNAGIINMNVALNQDTVVGERTVSWLLDSGAGYATNGTIAEDELAGAYIIMGHGATNVRMNRLIVSNEGGVNGDAIALTLDAPCSDVATTPFSEIQLNPYRYLNRNVTPSYVSVMCVPAVNADANEYFWGQTWGPCWIVPGGTDSALGGTEDERAVYFVGDGSVNAGVYVDAANRGHQLAGFIIDDTAASAGSAAPFVMLQLSI